ALVVKPDAYVVTLNSDYQDSWFIELDRATESLPRGLAKCKAYWRYWQSGREQSDRGVFPVVLWVVPDDRRKHQLVSGLAALPAAQCQVFSVALADQASATMFSGELFNTKQTKEVMT